MNETWPYPLMGTKFCLSVHGAAFSSAAYVISPSSSALSRHECTTCPMGTGLHTRCKETGIIRSPNLRLFNVVFTCIIRRIGKHDA